MRLTILGCSGSMSGRHSAASSYLVQAEDRDGRLYSVTLDFGPGAMGQLLNYLDPAELDAMFISHLHADHCADIVGMQVYRRWFPSGPLSQIPVYSPQDGLERTRHIGGDSEEETYAGEFDFRQLRAGDRFVIGPMIFETFAAEHTVECLGVRITAPSENGGEATLAYTGDTDICDTEIEMARGVDVLLSECAYEDERDTVRGIHMTGSRAGTLAQEAGAKKLLLTHLQPWTDPEKVRRDAHNIYSGPIRCVLPGDTYSI